MPRFAYKAYTRAGRLETGRIHAAHDAAALDALKARHLTPFEVAPELGASDVPWWAREVSLLGDTIPRKDLAAFLQSFALTLKARLPVPLALATALEDVRNRRLRAVLAEAEREVSEGRGMAASLADHPEVIPAQIAQMIALGEDANRLADTTDYAARLMQRELAFRTELSSALVYPIILLVASLVVIIGLIFFLAPTLAPVFAAVRADPPFVIAVMMAIRTFSFDYWTEIVLAAGIVVLGLLFVVRTRPSDMERLLFRLPVLGGALKMAEVLRSLMTLALMLESGAPILTALTAARNACTTQVFAGMFDRMAENVRAGGKLSTALMSDLVPPSIAQMIRIGEETDHLGEMLTNATTALDAQLRARIQAVLGLLTPILTLVIGGIVGLLIFSTLSAILDINDLAF